MAENSGISWTDHTFNPWMGCTKVSPACKNCYAERDMDHRYGKVKWGPSGTRVVTSDSNWRKPLAWNKRAADGYPVFNSPVTGLVLSPYRLRVFCASLADVFEDWQGPILDHHGEQLFFQSDGDWEIVLPASMAANRTGSIAVTMQDVRERLFRLIAHTPQLDWLLLTKRPENAMKMWPTWSGGIVGGEKPIAIPNVWLGTSIENQEWADKRLPYLHEFKRRGLVATTFVSAEPLVGEVILQGQRYGKVYNHLGEGGIDWVITGGESGPDARPANPDWYRSLRTQCEIAGTPFHFKQWGEWASEIVPGTSPVLDELAPNQCVSWGDGETNHVRHTRVGKKAAGRLLDGVEHNAFPRSSNA